MRVGSLTNEDDRKGECEKIDRCSNERWLGKRKRERAQRGLLRECGLSLAKIQGGGGASGCEMRDARCEAAAAAAS